MTIHVLVIEITNLSTTYRYNVYICKNIIEYMFFFSQNDNAEHMLFATCFYVTFT